MVRSRAPFDTVLEVLMEARALAGDLSAFAGRCDDERVRHECDALRLSLHRFEDTLRLYGLRLYADRSRASSAAPERS